MPTGAFPDKAVVPGGAQVRLTDTGFVFIADNLQPILAEVLPDGLGTCIAGSSSEGPLGGEYSFCQEQCDDGTEGCQVSLEIGGAAIVATPPNALAVEVTIDDFEFVIDAVVKPFGLNFVDCDITVSSPSFPVTVPITLQIEEPSRHLGFTIGEPELDMANLDLDLNGTLTCDIINLILTPEFIEDALFGAINGPVKDTVQALVEAELCMPCGEEGVCPPETICGDGDFCRRLDEGGRCVGKQLGLEGELDLASLMQGFVRGEPSPLRYLVLPGEFAHVEGGGVTLGTLTGAHMDPSRCVPRRHPPPPTPVPVATDLRGNLDPDGDPYHAGIGVHENLLARALWAAFDGGALCLQVDSSVTEYLSTATLGALLRSLGELSEGKARNVIIAISPQKEPEVTLGAGTVMPDPDEPGRFIIDEPLLTLIIRELGLHFYAFLDGRYVRVFTINADLHVPLAIAAVPEGLLPVLGDLGDAIVGVEIANNEFLSDDPSTLAALIPTLLGLLGPMLGDSLLSPIALPSFMGFSLQVQKAAGIEDDTMLGVFASLELAPAPEGGAEKPKLAAETRARLDSVLPPRAESHEAVRRSSDAWPRASLDVSGSGLGSAGADQLEYQIRVDGGSWGLFHRAPAARLRVVHPYLAFPGPHTVEVRGRLPGHVASLDRSPASVRVDTAKAPPAALPEGGCATAGPGGRGLLGGLALLLAGLMVWRRRRYLAPALVVPLIALALGGCSGCDDERALGGSQSDVGNAGDAGDGECGEPCPEGFACQAGRCVEDEQAPCPGGCPDGSRCCEAQAECVEVAQADCSRHECEAGFEPEVLDPGAYDPDMCEWTRVQCACKELPPLALGSVGRYLGVDRRPGGGLAFSAYNATYGDLMLAWTDTVRLPTEAEWLFVDGLPAEGEIAGAPSGPRGGVRRKGPEVGRWTSLAVAADGTLHVVYRDEANKALRYVRGVPKAEGAGYELLISTLDDTADAGTYARLTLGSDGIPAVAYRVRTRTEEDAFSGLRVAWAQGSSPAGPDDWTRHDVEVVSLGFPCGGECGLAEKCIVEENLCARSTGGCEGGCGDDESCFDAVCKKIWVPPTGPTDFPEGMAVGIAARRDPNDRLCVAYHDHGAGVLRFVRVTAEGAEAEPTTIAGPGPEEEKPHHLGEYPSLWIDSNGAEHLAYMDTDAGQLVHLQLLEGTREPIDDGLRRSQSGRVSENWIGADARVVRDRAGRLLVYYQDQTFLDLLVATWRQETWEFATVAGHEGTYEGAFGFHTVAMPGLDGEPGDSVVFTFRHNNQADPPERGLALRWR